MPKNKKTRKQKIQVDQRRDSYSFNFVASASSQEKHFSNTISTSAYRYLAGDLLKTLILTIAIVSLELVLHALVTF